MSNTQQFVTKNISDLANATTPLSGTELFAIEQGGVARKLTMDVLQALVESVDWSDISGKPTFATVATSGSYNDLSNKPTIPTEFWEQGVDSNDNPVQGAIRPKGFTNGGLDYTNTASGVGAFAVGIHNTASGQGSAAFGNVTIASGVCSFAQGGSQTTASGSYSHAEGYKNVASGDISHVEGRENVASGKYAHAEGWHTIAETKAAHVSGMYNTHDPTFTTVNDFGTYAEIVGNGADEQNRANARTLDWSGNEWVAGLVSVGSSSSPPTPTANNHLTTKKYVDDIVGNIETLLASI